jgi:carbonic anhydrase
VRVAGNVCDTDMLASVEYAAEHLGSQLCVVLGHEACGAVKAAATLDPAAVSRASPAVQALLQRIEPAVRRARSMSTAPESILACAEAENAQQTVVDALRQSSILRGLATKGRFKIVAARYHLDKGDVEWLPERPFDVSPAPVAHEAPHQSNCAPHVALERLQQGHRRFRAGAAPIAEIDHIRREKLTEGQHPVAIVVTCSDSRVAPEHLFDCGLGELFVVRVAGNVLNEDVQASIEYAAEHTGASLVVVMGHSGCGAVKAACAATEPGHGAHAHDHGPNLTALLAKLAPTVETARRDRLAGDALVECAIERNVLAFLTTLRGKSSIVKHLEHDGQLTMLGAVYQLDTGDVRWLIDAEQAAAAPGVETAPRKSAAPAPAKPDEHGRAQPAAPAPGHTPRH